ncbi:hypothetical protein, partial [Salmonella enterica]|uniref:hypothetical protein n=1 Tax=Salmonella enterica TaxID=28901 RepID=UPI003526107C
SAFPDMPRSAIASGMVDEVLSPEEIASALVDLVCSPRPELRLLQQGSNLQAQLDAILRLVRAKSGHDFSSYKTNMVLRRIERRRTVTGCQDLDAYTDLLKADSQEAHQLVREMLIGVTSFFRDPEAFAVLRCEVLP